MDFKGPVKGPRPYLFMVVMSLVDNLLRFLAKI